MFSCCSAQDEIFIPVDLPGPVSKLREQLKGDLILFGEEQYADVRLYGESIKGRKKQTKTWNLDAAKYPSAFARPVDVGDVCSVVNYAREHCIPNGTLLSVACGRHSHVCLVQNSLCMDMSRMRNVRLDKEEKIIYAEGGCLNADIDRVTIPHNLAVTLGHAGSTGVGGLIPQGGHGFLERTIGLSVDNLLEVTIVTANGEIVKASKEENQELFWGIRGAGHNFGIITEFKLQLTPIQDTYYGGNRYHLPLGFGPWPARKDLLFNWATSISKGNRHEATGAFIMVAELPLVIETYAWLGDKEEGKTHFKEALKFGFPLVNHIGSKCTYAKLQSVAPDQALKVYMSGSLVQEITEEVAQICDTYAKTAPASQCSVIVIPTGGVAATGDDVPACRNGNFLIVINGAWESAADRPTCITWVKNFRKELMEVPNASAYGTLAGNADYFEKNGGGHFGTNYARLQALKRQMDPTNVFRLNINVEPL